MSAIIKNIKSQVVFLRQSEGTLWLISYIATLLIPWMLIFSRGGADVMCTLVGVLFLWRSYQHKNWLWRNDQFIRICLIAWLWMMVVVSPFAHNIMYSYSTAAPWIRYILFFAAMRHWVLVRREALLLLACSLAVMLSLTVIDTLWQYIHGVSFTGHPIAESGRLTGPMNNVKVGIFIGKLFLPVIGIGLYFSLTWRNKKWTALNLVFIVICLMTILLSGERTAFVSSSLGIITIVGLTGLGERQWRKATISLSCIALAIITWLFYSQPYLQGRVDFLMQNLRDFNSSAYLQLFWVGFQLGNAYWITGTGFKGFRELCPNYESVGITKCNIHPHNPYIEWYVETGLIGLVIFLMMIASLILTGLRHYRKSPGVSRIPSIFMLGTLVIHFFPFLGTQSFFSNWPAILLWYSVSVAYASLNLVPLSSETHKT